MKYLRAKTSDLFDSKVFIFSSLKNTTPQLAGCNVFNNNDDFILKESENEVTEDFEMSFLVPNPKKSTSTNQQPRETDTQKTFIPEADKNDYPKIGLGASEPSISRLVQ